MLNAFLPKNLQKNICAVVCDTFTHTKAYKSQKRNGEILSAPNFRFALKFIIYSAFSVTSTPLSQCSTVTANSSSSAHTSRDTPHEIIENGSLTRESTPSRELNNLLGSLSLGSEHGTGRISKSVRRGIFLYRLTGTS